ncbi:AbrB/MazE/SpoVT family DNA-binding domain-containing protein [Paenibacillus thiaminolyticus]|uniref:AbrB/MazE/SpoVT family DNA-binding domain-containing protein n=1 Tax=Paenibacillus thiaminolyticus TaxID=49283 RepID=A0A3A3H364_PANTH|nr:AbrB/MazE/SpoVT family DNA-binding domain-containing protein [Paenibacillus thiaminolyticus]RJG23576.1 AbrB/MazE/SpoVT family DNA-binding domain-containing protein [Paenibacillus thiaminolyticus]
MKDTGMIRSLDSLGRIVIPVEIRNARNIEIGDAVEFFVLDDHILVLRKYTSTECTFCRSMESVSYYKDQFICSTCLKELAGAQDLTPIAPQPQAKKRAKTSELIQRLREAFEEHPGASQKELAKLLGVSQGRISQLKKEM